MPKARFNPTRHKSRASRHNPISGSKRNQGASTAGEGSNFTSSNETPPLTALREASCGTLDAQSLAIPLLLKLPLPGVEVTPAPSSADTTWALSSLSLLLTSKPARRSLLASQHRLLARLVRALSHEDAAARAEASGAMRNLCVEGGFAARGKLAKEGALEVVVEQLKRSAASLGIYGDGEVLLSTHTATSTKYVAVDKPIEEMNRKERRHAAKAAAAAAGDEMDTSEATAQPPGADEEVVSPVLTHLGNLCVILWCILEADSAHLAPLTPYLVSLTALLAATLSRAATASQHAQASAEASGVEREAARIRTAEVEAGVAAANALLALVDTHAPAAAALVGIARPDLEAAQRAVNKKTKSKPPRSIGVLDGADATKADGMRNLAALDAGVAALQHALQNGGAAALQSISLGLLSLGILRNATASLPEELRSRVVLPGQVQLATYETTRALPALLGTLDALGAEWGWTAELGSREKGVVDDVAPSGGPDDMDTAEDAGTAVQDELDSAGGAAPTRAAQRAEERLGALQLALEVLAELASGTDAQDGHDQMAEADEDTWADDDEMAIDAETATGSAAASAGEYAASTPALLFSSGLPTRLLSLATPPSELAYSAQSMPQAEALITIATRAISALSNLVHALANAAPGPPSAPTPSAELAVLQSKFAAWRASTPLWSEVWSLTFETACELGTHGTPALAPLGTAMGILWALARAHEGANVPLSPSDFSEAYPRARSGTGVIAALLEAGLSASDDSLRVGALGALGPLARAPATPPSSVAQIGQALVQVLDSLPTPGAAATQGAATAETATVAINALIDTFADEESAYDIVAFRQTGLLPRLQATAQKVKAMARAIDRRKNPGLHEAAAEATENLRGFVQYRASLKF